MKIYGLCGMRFEQDNLPRALPCVHSVVAGGSTVGREKHLLVTAPPDTVGSPPKPNFMLEIERKFLVRSMPRNLTAFPCVEIHQGYLACERGRHVRVRRIAGNYWLTAKHRRGIGRAEETIPLTAEQFAMFWPLTEGRRVQKTRYRVPHRHLTIEIDIFNGQLEGLIVAEIEFADEQGWCDFIPPEWLGEEVTHDPAYRNTTLAVAGFSLEASMMTDDAAIHSSP